MKIPINLIIPNDFNPNEMLDSNYSTLKDDIYRNGLTYPIVVRPLHNGKFEIVDGFHRWKACKELGWSDIPCSIEKISREVAQIRNYRLNKERGNLNPFKEAQLFLEFVEKGFSYSQIGEKFGVDKTHVAHRLDLLSIDETLTRVNGLSPSHWEVIATIKDHSLQKRLVQEVTTNRLSVRETEENAKVYRILESIPREHREEIQQIRIIRRGKSPHRDILVIPEDFSFYYVCEFYDMTKGTWFLFPTRNFVLSAYHHLTEGTLRTALARNDLKAVIAYRDEIDSLFLDSGMIAAFRRKVPDFLNRAKDVIELGNLLNVDVMSHLDANMEPFFLKENNMTQKKALEYTVRNAQILLDESEFKGTKCFVVQGWTITQYEWCINQFQDMGILDSKHWIGIGTTCMRQPPILYDIYERCCKMIHEIDPKIHIHAFGIAKPEWIVKLYQLGVRSADSATPDLACAFNHFLTDKGTKVRLSKKRTREMEVGQVIHNYWVYYLQLNEEFAKLNCNTGQLE